MCEIGRVLPRAEHLVSGARLGGQLGGLLLPRHHRHRSGAHGPVVRALLVDGARRAARHRSRHRARAPRRSDPARLREVRAHPRGDGGQRDPLSRALGGARRGQGARHCRDRRSIGSPSCSAHHDGSMRRRCAQAGLDPERRRRTALARAVRRRSWTSRATCRSIPAAFCSGTSRSRRSCRSRTRPWRIAPSSSGTRTTSRRSGCSRSTCSALGALTHDSHSASICCERTRAARPVDGHDPARRRRDLRDDPRAATRSACSRSRAARRCRCCRACKPQDLLRPGDRGEHRAPGPDHGRHGASVPAPAQRRSKPVDYPHPSCLEPVLKKTLGVPLFQEQVMKLAIVAADYTPGEADQLRRDMAAWRSTGRIEEHHERLVTRMSAKGHPARVRRARVQADPRLRRVRLSREPRRELRADRVRHRVLASCTIPAEFTCALLNAQPMGFYSPATIVEDAKRHGVEVRPIDVRRSRGTARSEDGALRMGLRYVKGLSEGDGKAIVAARAERPFADLDDFVRRTRLDGRALERLAEAGAFDSLERSRRSLWSLRPARARRMPLPVARRTRASPRWRRWRGPLGLPGVEHSTRGHPLSQLRDELRAQGLPDARGRHDARRGAGLLRRAGDLPAAAGHRVGRGVHDAGGRDRLREPGGLARGLRGLRDPGRTAVFLGVTGKLQSRAGWCTWSPSSSGCPTSRRDRPRPGAATSAEPATRPTCRSGRCCSEREGPLHVVDWVGSHEAVVARAVEQAAALGVDGIIGQRAASTRPR